MDDGPFRVPQPADRRGASRSEPVRRPIEEPRVVAEPPRQNTEAPSRSSSKPRRADKSRKSSSSLKWASIIGIVIVLVLGILFVWSSSQSKGVAIDGNKYQAVYLMNGQIYFGKLSNASEDNMKLTKVYYLQTPTEGADTKSSNEVSASNVQLIKLSSAIYGPEDEMVISKDKILYYQNLQADSKAAKLIENDKQSIGN